MTARFASALPVLAIVAFVVGVAAIIWSAGSTLGYDFQAYEGAARRLLDGQPLYDTSVTSAGGFGLYLYPPPFALALIPFAEIGGQAAIWAWTALLLAAFLGAVAIIPVGRTVRWAIILLAAIDWPFLYSIKLGQVGPLLFLLLAIGWSRLDRPGHPDGPGDRVAVGASIGLGVLIKIQPVLLIGWAAVTGRWRIVAVALVVILAAALLLTAVGGIQPWFDYPIVVARIAAPITTLHNFTPGAVAWQAGASVIVAEAIQAVVTIGAIGAALIAIRRTSSDASYLVAIVASQLISPLLWDHYAMLLLLPVAWLLEQRQWWAIAIPLATSIVTVGLAAPAAVYPIVFVVCLVAPIVVGWDRRTPDARLEGAAA